MISRDVAREKILFLYALLIAAVFLAYSSACAGAFLHDDDFLIAGNGFLRSWHYLGSIFTTDIAAGWHGASVFYRPLQILLYLLIYQLAGPTPLAFHLLNISLHAVNACLVYMLGRKLGFNPGATLLAALLWALHPIHTEAIAYMSATADPLHAFFCLLGIIVLLPDFALRKVLLAAPLFVFALLSKENAVIFPLLIAATVLYAGQHKSRDLARTEFLWLIAVIYLIAYLLAHVMAAKHGSAIYSQPDFYYTTGYAQNMASRFFTCLATLPAYAQLLLWPTHLHMERSFPIYPSFIDWHVLVGAAMVLGAIIFCITHYTGRGSSLTWGLLWFMGAHALDTGIATPLEYTFLEHWMYLPTVGLFLGLGQLIAEVLEHRDKIKIVALGTCVMLVLVLGAATWRQNKTWHDPVAFYTNIFANERSTARAHSNLGTVYEQRGDYTLAIEQYDIALGMSDKYPETYTGLAAALFGRKQNPADIDAALEDARHALAMDPPPLTVLQIYNLLMDIYTYKNNAAEAAVWRAKAKELAVQFEKAAKN